MAWWLVDSIMNGTLDEDYPIKEYVDGHGDVHPKREDMSMSVEGDIEHDISYYDYTRNGLDENPFEQNFLADNDDQAAHHFNLDKEVDRVELKLNSEVQQSDNMSAHYFKYHEDEILQDIESYVSGTYRGHYTGTTHEYRNVQTLDLMASRDLASAFCQSNIIKYGSRYGSKDGKSKKDLLKVIHYAMLLLHFDEHYGKPSITSGNIDHTMP